MVKWKIDKIDKASPMHPAQKKIPERLIVSYKVACLITEDSMLFDWIGQTL